MDEPFRINNFDLIRLIAALQVALAHGLHHLEIAGLAWLSSILGLIPGVPIFFFISGFLISKAFEKNYDVKQYTLNRIFRIFPALIACVSLSLLIVYFSGYFSTIQFNPTEFIGWTFGQMTFLQFYNPEFMRGFGVGVLNGSLWTISVELQFYIIVPIFYFAARHLKFNMNYLVLSLILLFVIVNRLSFFVDEKFENAILFKIWKVTLNPWFYMFLFGIFYQRNFQKFHGYLAGKGGVLLTIYLIVAFVSVNYFNIKTGNAIGPLLYILLAAVVFSLAYTAPELSGKLLMRNDVSYGIYIYHMPIINFMVYFGYTGQYSYLVITIASTILISVASWKIIERPFLKLKKTSLNPVLK